jgi:hypothetical protein
MTACRTRFYSPLIRWSNLFAIVTASQQTLRLCRPQLRSQYFDVPTRKAQPSSRVIVRTIGSYFLRGNWVFATFLMGGFLIGRAFPRMRNPSTTPGDVNDALEQQLSCQQEHIPRDSCPNTPLSCMQLLRREHHFRTGNLHLGLVNSEYHKGGPNPS